MGDFPLAFTRHATSRMGTGYKWFGQGHNWRHSYQYDLVQSSSAMDLYLPSGDVLHYTNYDGSRWWQKRADYTDWLAQQGSNAYLYRQDASKLTFRRISTSPVTWQLQSITDPSGNVTALTYDSSNRLVLVTEPAGRWLKLSYGGISVDQSQFSVLGSVPKTPPAKTWSQLTVSDTTAYRYLRYYGTNTGSDNSYAEIAEMEFYDKAGNKLSGVPFGNSPSYNNDPNRTFDKASDGNVNTYYTYAYPNFGFTGLDLGAGNAKAIGKVRYYPRAGYESRMGMGGNAFGQPGCRFEGSNSKPMTLDAIVKVESSDGRMVAYGYNTIPDTVLPQSWLVLSAAYYGDGTAAAYDYALSFAGQPPLMTEANDPRYGGAGVHMKYNYWQWTVYGSIHQELNGVTGSVVASLSGLGSAHDGGGTNQVTYPNGKISKVTYAANGMLSQRVDGNGGIWKFNYDSNNTGYLASQTDPLNRTTSYTYDDAGLVLSQTNPDNSAEQWTRNGNGQELSHTDELGRKTTTTRDSRGRVTRRDYPDTSYETWTYNNFSQVLVHRLRNGGTEGYTYNARGLRIAWTDALNHTTVVLTSLLRTV